jgi:hypothetical protein
VLSVSLWLGACAPANGGASATPTASPSLAAASPAAAPASAVPSSAPSPGASPSPDAQSAIDAAVHDAAARLNVGPSDVHVDQAEARQWPDASLGCPRQGVLYAQIVTPGYLVVVSGAGKQLEYHADSRGRVVLCAER